MLTNSLQLDPLQQSWFQFNLWILSQVKQPSPASYMLLKTVMISRAHKQAAAPVQTGTSLPTCPTSTYSDNLQRSLLLYLPQGKFTPVGGDTVDCHIYLHTSSSSVFPCLSFMWRVRQCEPKERYKNEYSTAQFPTLLLWKKCRYSFHTSS